MSNSSNPSTSFVAEAVIPANYGLIISGIFASIANLSLMFVMFRERKKENTNFIWNMLHLSFADFLLGICATSQGSKGVYDLITHQGSNKSDCFAQLFFSMFALLAVVTQTFCMSFDRLLSVSIPKTYHFSLSGYKMQLINLSQWLVAILFPILGPLKFSSQFEKIPTCNSTLAFLPMYLQAYIVLLAVYSVAIVVMYISILIRVRTRILRVRRAKGNEDKTKKQLETNVLSSVGLVVGLYFITWLCSTIGAQVANLCCGPTIAQVVIPYLPVTVVFNGFINVLVYLWKNDTVRRDFISVFHIQPRTNVKPMKVSATSGPSRAGLNHNGSTWA